MTYKTDGSSHHNGVTGEKVVLEYFNNELNYDFISKSINKALSKNIEFKKFKFIKKGGTQNRTDIFCNNNKIRISIKSKKKENQKYKGTFDLINTSKIKDFICDNKPFEDNLNAWYQLLDNIKQGNKENWSEKTFFDAEINKHCNLILNSIKGIQIEKIFSKISEMEGENIEIIRDYNNSVKDVINNDHLHFLKHKWFIDEFETIDKNQIINSEDTSSSIKTKNKKPSFLE